MESKTYPKSLDVPVMVGRIFMGRYETMRLLGEGGMGRVYLARQMDLGRQVVVKVMHDHIAADPKFRDRFQRETLLMARFQHPYVVTLYDASLNDPEGPCIVMEYVKGVALETMLHCNGRCSPARFSRLLGQLCEALQAAHNEGIVHRDLKPANLMVVDADSPYEKLKVMDFGLAKMTPRRKKTGDSTDTGAEFAVGTPGYISPEQVRGENTDHRADLYSVGVILYEMLTGRLPFSGHETMDVLLSHAQDPPPSFESIGLGDVIPEAVEQVVMNCLAKDPTQRPQSARELADQYENSLIEVCGRETITYTPHPAQLPNGDLVGNMASSATTPLPTDNTIIEDDPGAVVHQLRAWMPEAIAAYKLRGFVDAVGGRVIESVPGQIRVRLGSGNLVTPASGPLAWLGITTAKRTSVIDIELRLQSRNPKQKSLLSIVVVMKPADKGLVTSPAWRARCDEIFCDLRGHLMG